MAEEPKPEDSDTINEGTEVGRVVQELVTNPKFKKLPNPTKQEMLRIVTVSLQRSHSGPLPDIETLKGYADLIPDGANRVMQMAETQLNHRIDLENTVVKAQMEQSKLGQIFAFLFGIGTLSVAAYAINMGYEWSGGAIGITGITGLLIAFLKGMGSQNTSLKDKKAKT